MANRPLPRAAIAALALVCAAGGITLAQAHEPLPAPERAAAQGHLHGVAIADASVAGRTRSSATTDLATLAAGLQVGDIVFTRIPFAPFTRITEVTGGWSNHVGIVVDISGDEPLIAESKVPLSRRTPLSDFLRRSDHGRAAVMRPPQPLDVAQQVALRRAVEARMGVLYDTGFNLASSRQFCSRFVREVLADATGEQYGELQRFDALLASNPGADQRFWTLWYFGRIPWQRVTVTPESMRRDARLQTVFDGQVQLARL